MSNDDGAPFLTRGEFEALKHDPLQILARATETITRLRQQEVALEAEKTTLQHQLDGVNADGGFDSQRHREVGDAVAELERDHRRLAVRHAEAEFGNRRLAAVIDRLRHEEEVLGAELVSLQREQAAIAAEHAEVVTAIAEDEKRFPEDTAKMRALQDAIDGKIASVDAIAKELVACAKKTAEVQRRTEIVGSERLALEAETTALEQTTKQKERTVNYLQHEVTQLDETVKSRTDELVEMKKQMTSMLVELQLQITRAEEEMTRLQNAVANEKNLTGRQNVWQAKELHAKTEDLLTARQEMAHEHGKLKSELVIVREKAERLKNNMLVVEKQNKVLSETLQQLEEEEELMKSAYGKRKNTAFEDMTKQGAVMQQLNTELQAARESIYLMKSKMCKDCHASIMQSEEKGKKVSPPRG